MKVLAKFYVSEVSEVGNYNSGRAEIFDRDNKPTGLPCRKVKMQAVHDDGLDKENASFAKATPSGSIEFYLNNEVCADEFKPGDVYYVEFTRKD